MWRKSLITSTISGLALLQNNSQFPESHEDLTEAPAFHLQEAATLHKFAEAAYTVRLNNTNPPKLFFRWVDYISPPCVAIFCRGHCLMLGGILLCFYAHGYAGKGY